MSSLLASSRPCTHALINETPTSVTGRNTFRCGGAAASGRHKSRRVDRGGPMLNELSPTPSLRPPPATLSLELSRSRSTDPPARRAHRFARHPSISENRRDDRVPQRISLIAWQLPSIAERLEVCHEGGGLRTKDVQATERLPCLCEHGLGMRCFCEHEAVAARRV